MVILYIDKKGAAEYFQPNVAELVDKIGHPEKLVANSEPIVTKEPSLIFTEFAGLDAIATYLRAHPSSMETSPVSITIENINGGMQPVSFEVSNGSRIPTVVFTNEYKAREYFDGKYVLYQILGELFSVPAVIKKSEDIRHRMSVLNDKIKGFDYAINQFLPENWENNKPSYFGVSYSLKRHEQLDNIDQEMSLQSIMIGGYKDPNK